jgi:spore coat polysaccharide biosynthesis protein SpsF
MVDGLLNKKVAFIIQARMQSTRLPGKILMPLPVGSNVPLLGRIVETLKISNTNHSIIVATSTNPENNLLETFCKENNVACFRGSEDDVLSRFIDIVKNTDYDLIVRLTADNPFVDAKV